MQILKGDNFASSLGGQLGSGLGTGLQELVNQKIQQMQQTKGLSALGIPQEAAEQISSLNPRMQELVLKNYLSAAENQGVSQALGGLGGEATTMDQDADQQFQSTQDLGEMLRRPRLSSEQKIKIAKMKQQREMAERKESVAEQHYINKETLPIYKEINQKYKDSRENDRRLGRMEKLVEKGNLGSPAFNNLLESVSKGAFGVGINLKHLQSADAQEFDKLSTEFLKGAKELFGTRVTDNEIRMFMKMVPTLAQSDAAKMRVISNMRVGNQANKIRRDAMSEIIKENGGKRPLDLEEMLEERTEAKLDRLAEEFKKNIRPREEAEESKSFYDRAKTFITGDKGLAMPF